MNQSARHSNQTWFDKSLFELDLPISQNKFEQDFMLDNIQSCKKKIIIIQV